MCIIIYVIVAINAHFFSFYSLLFTPEDPCELYIISKHCVEKLLFGVDCVNTDTRISYYITFEATLFIIAETFRSGAGCTYGCLEVGAEIDCCERRLDPPTRMLSACGSFKRRFEVKPVKHGVIKKLLRRERGRNYHLSLVFDTIF